MSDAVWRLGLLSRITRALGDDWTNATKNAKEQAVAVSDRGLLSIGRGDGVNGFYLVLEIPKPDIHGLGKNWIYEGPGRWSMIFDNDANLPEMSTMVAKVLHYLGYLSAKSPAKQFRANKDMSQENYWIVRGAVERLVSTTSAYLMTKIQFKLLGIAD